MSTPTPLYIPAPYQDSAEFGRLILRDGSTATVRVAAAQDAMPLGDFFHRLSPQSRQQRFFSFAEPTPEFVRSLCDSSNPQTQLTLVVTRWSGERDLIIAAGTYVSRDAKTAEVAMAVEDKLQGKGIGGHLLERLALLAARAGFTRFWAITQMDNRSMIDVFRHSGFPITEQMSQGYVELNFSVLPTESSVHLSEMRDRVFTACDPSSIGYRILQALVMNRFQGPVYPVNRKATVVGSIRAYPSVIALPESVDLAVISVPREAVLGVIDECARRGVKAVVVITAGFAEADEVGRSLQKQLLEKIRGYGMRMIGPNCLGLLNTDPSIQLNASFSPVFPPAGRISRRSASSISIPSSHFRPARAVPPSMPGFASLRRSFSTPVVGADSEAGNIEWIYIFSSARVSN